MGGRNADGSVGGAVIDFDLPVVLDDRAAGEYHVADIADTLVILPRRQQRRKTATDNLGRIIPVQHHRADTINRACRCHFHAVVDLQPAVLGHNRRR